MTKRGACFSSGGKPKAAAAHRVQFDQFDDDETELSSENDTDDVAEVEEPVNKQDEVIPVVDEEENFAQHAEKVAKYAAEWSSLCDGARSYMYARGLHPLENSMTDRFSRRLSAGASGTGMTNVGLAVLHFLDEAVSKYPHDAWPKQMEDWYPLCLWVAENTYVQRVRRLSRTPADSQS